MFSYLFRFALSIGFVIGPCLGQVSRFVETVEVLVPLHSESGRQGWTISGNGLGAVAFSGELGDFLIHALLAEDPPTKTMRCSDVYGIAVSPSACQYATIAAFGGRVQLRTGDRVKSLPLASGYGLLAIKDNALVSYSYTEHREARASWGSLVSTGWVGLFHINANGILPWIVGVRSVDGSPTVMGSYGPGDPMPYEDFHVIAPAVDCCEPLHCGVVVRSQDNHRLLTPYKDLQYESLLRPMANVHGSVSYIAKAAGHWNVYRGNSNQKLVWQPCDRGDTRPRAAVYSTDGDIRGAMFLRGTSGACITGDGFHQDFNELSEIVVVSLLGEQRTFHGVGRNNKNLTLFCNNEFFADGVIFGRPLWHKDWGFLLMCWNLKRQFLFADGKIVWSSASVLPTTDVELPYMTVEDTGEIRFCNFDGRALRRLKLSKA